ncbi:AAA family ATPase [Microaerobacter geothermalis]|uniref:AAA family ATPase n=1 Tax=Microaerobacter geothermalis TaxID=674972 RepID=UPI001F321CB6|nr:AAA family ATPase [Microaerobacter geothermalis]MCF6094504.1 AAA family ATPase [Microaerobacter geothermalis]
MSILLATGNPFLDNSLEEYFKWEHRIEYLEELEFIDQRFPEIQTIILSMYIPSIHDEKDIHRKYKTICYLLKQLKASGIRFIVLASDEIPFEVLEQIYLLDIYDLIITDNGEIDISTILDRIYHPKTKAEAEKELMKYRPKKEDVNLYEEEEEEIKEKQKEEQAEENKGFLFLSQKNKPLESTEEASRRQIAVKANYRVISRKQDLSSKVSIRDVSKEEYAHTRIDESKLISFWSAAPGQGKRTLSQSLAKVIASRNYKVLYVELDYFYPSFAWTSGLSHPAKNIFQLAMHVSDQDEFDLKQYVASPRDVFGSQKRIQQAISKIPPKLDFMALPSNFVVEEFPSIKSEQFIDHFIKGLKNLSYDAIILNLPNEIEHLFSFPVMLESDEIFNILTPHPGRIVRYGQLKKKLKNTPLNMTKWSTIFNQVHEEIQKDALDSFIQEESRMVVPFDPKRALLELDLSLGSPMIDKKMAELADMFGFIDTTVPEKKKKFLSLR